MYINITYNINNVRVSFFPERERDLVEVIIVSKSQFIAEKIVTYKLQIIQ